MAVITKQELEDAAVDAGTIESVVNGDSSTTVTSRLGESIKTLAKTIADAEAQLADEIRVSSGIYETVAAGLAATSDGDYFSVATADNDTFLTFYSNDGGSAVEIAEYPRLSYFRAILNEVTGSGAVQGVSFSVTDSDGRRSWIEADLLGNPTDESADLIASSVLSRTNDLTFAAERFEAFSNPNVSVSITDENGRKTWIEANGQGLPTDYASESIKEAVTPTTNSYIAKFSITDENGRRSWLEIDQDGNPTENSISIIENSILGGLTTATFSNPYVSLSITDSSGRKTWLEVDETGSPTDHASSEIKEVVTPTTQSKSIMFSITDNNNRRSWLEADYAGEPTENAKDSIIAVVEERYEAISPATYKLTATATTAKRMSSGPDIVCYGDSMTAGAGGGGTTYATVLASLSGRTVRNSGVGGETSVTITARSGAYPFYVNILSGEIPATTTAEELEFYPINGASTLPLRQGDGVPDGGFTGTLYPANVHGTITRVGGTSTTGGVYYFTRTTAGDAITADRTQYFVLDYARARRNDIWCIWIGQNGPSVDRAIQDTKYMIEYMQAVEKRWIIIPKPTSTDEIDQQYFEEFGHRCVFIRKYMVTPIYDTDGVTVISSYGLDDAGITPTAQDLTDISNGVIPTSLRADAVHFTAAGYTILGNLVYQKLIELDWLD